MKLYKIKEAPRSIFGADTYFVHLGIWFPIFSTLQYQVVSKITSYKGFDLAISGSIRRMKENK